MSRSRPRSLARVALVVLGAWAAALAGNRALQRVTGPSMLPSLWPDDLVVAMPPRLVAPRVGDLVVAEVDGVRTVKRLAALGPATVRLQDGHLAVDGVWWDLPDVVRADEERGWRVGTGEVLLLGDHRGRSTDGRTTGAVPASALRRVVVARLAPFAPLRGRAVPVPGPRERPGVRLVVLDPADRVLAFRVADADVVTDRASAATWWEAPGGGRHDGEPVRDAAVRELAEEVGATGLEPVDLGRVHVRETTLGGLPLRKVEQVLAVRLPDDAVDDAGWTDAERRDIAEHRWWTPDELDALAPSEVVPPDLADLARLARDLV